MGDKEIYKENAGVKNTLFALAGKSLAVLLMIALAAGCTLLFSVKPYAQSKEVSLPGKAEMTVGKTKTLNLKNNKKKVQWTTSNKKVVKIIKKTRKTAVIKAVGKGTARITAKAGKKKYVCRVSVKQPKQVSFVKKATLSVGETKVLKLKNNKKKVAWENSSKKVVRIVKKSKTQVQIKALKAGTATITAKIDKKKYSCKLTVKKKTEDENGGEAGGEEAGGEEAGGEEDGEEAGGEEKEYYGYTITPLLPPFDEYFYVKTEDPNPSKIRFVDKKSQYYTPTDEKDLCSIVPTTHRFLDVQYENRETGRVKGGYIFEKSGTGMDGGELILQEQVEIKKPIDGYEGYYQTVLEYQDTPVTVVCPQVKDYLQYLIDNYTTASMTFFEKMDGIQAALDELALYPRSVKDMTKRSTVTPYPLLSVSPYPELSLNEWYAMYENAEDGILLDYLYPYILNSASFPSLMYNAAYKLEPSCTVQWGDVHYLIEVTKDGVTKEYGGAGAGGDNPLYSNHIEKLFLFDGSAEDYAVHASLEGLAEKRTEYGKLTAEDAAVYRDQIQGDTFRKTVAPGSWIRVAVEGWSLGGEKAFAYVTQGTQFKNDPLSYISSIEDVWIDGRYINECNRFEKGAKFEDHPTSSIVIRSMPYTDMKGIEHCGDVRFVYDAGSQTWRSNAYTYGYIYDADELILPDEFILTKEEVDALAVDQNTDTDPSSGFIYDGSVEPGTPF